MAITHMGQPPGNHFTLKSSIAGNFTIPTDLQLRRITPDGIDAGVESIPPGQVLVITDVDWCYLGGTAGQVQILKIDIQPISLSPPPREQQSRTVFYSAITLDTKGGGSTTEAMTSGFIVSSRARILFSTFPGGGVLQDVIIRGYLL
jgi:hypothetical protein